MTAAEVMGWALPPTSMVRNARRGLTGLALVAVAMTAAVGAAPQPADLSAIAARETAPPATTSAARSEQTALQAYGKLPLAFVPNAGQTDARVRFSAKAVGASFYFTQTEATFSFAKASERDRRVVLSLAFLGANPETRLEGRGLLPGKVNYLLGSDPDKWHTNLPSYGQVVYRKLWPGIDMVFRGDANRLKYEFVLHPGAKVEDIRLAYRGADGLALGARGQLLIATGAGTLTDVRPVSYQDVRGRRVPVKSRFLLEPAAGQATAYGFGVGTYDPRRPLVIDPGLLYSTYLGGASTDVGNPIAVDGAGNAWITGETSSTNFPTTAGAADTTYNGNIDAFVTKLNTAGTALVYSTYLGGAASSDRGFGLAVDGAGNAYVTGETSSNNFPTTAGAFDTTFNGNTDAFVTKLNAAGSALLYSTYLGGSSSDRGAGIAIDAAGSAYVTGRTNSSSFPTTLLAFDTTHNGGEDVFVTKLNAAGSAPLAYSTFLGSGGDDRGFGIAVDGTGNSYVTGETNSGGFPTTVGAFDTSQNGGFDVFVTKLNAAGSGLGYSTFLGGGGDDRGRGIVVDGANSAYVTGLASSGFPTTAAAFDTTHNGGDDAFVTKLNPSGSARIYSTFLGGSSADRGFSIAVDVGGNAYVTGETDSSGFPTTTGAFDRSKDGIDAFVTKVNPAGTALLYSTFLGGSNAEQAFGIAVDGAGKAYVTGQTQSSNFPTTTGAFDTTYNTNGDAFVTKLDMIGTPTALTLAPAADTNPVGTSHTVTATVTDFGGSPVPGVTVRFSVAGPNPTSGSGTTNASGEATFTYTGNNAGSDAIHAFADTNNNGVQNAGEPFGDATKTWTPATPATLVLDPAADTNPVGTSHTVTATVKDAGGNPVANVTVRFTVTGAVNTSGPCTTNTAGQCDFTYKGPTAPGADAITAFADTDDDSTQDTGEPGGAASKTWTPAAPATLILTPATDTNPVGAEHTVTATVQDAFGNPVPGVTVRFSVTGAVNTSGQCTTNTAGQCDFTYDGPTTPGADAIAAFADSDNDTTQDIGEPAGAASKTWTPGAPATLILDPLADTNTVGEEHCVTATVEDAFGNPVPGVTVRFSVPTAVATFASPSSGSDVTDADGEAIFCYSASLPGQDAIHAFADTDDDTMQDVGEPFGDATKTWTPPASTEFCEVKIAQGGWIIANNDDRASFGGNAKVAADGSSVQGQQQYQDHGPGQPRNVHSVELLATTCSDDLTTASIFGTATIDGSGTFVFRIDVIDQGQPGTNDSYGIMLSDGYFSGQHRLQGGNVTIHK
jgi:hypothetical protein